MLGAECLMVPSSYGLVQPGARPAGARLDVYRGPSRWRLDRRLRRESKTIRCFHSVRSLQCEYQVRDWKGLYSWSSQAVVHCDEGVAKVDAFHLWQHGS